jgi:hypothetical protein
MNQSIEKAVARCLHHAMEAEKERCATSKQSYEVILARLDSQLGVNALVY